MVGCQFVALETLGHLAILDWWTSEWRERFPIVQEAERLMPAFEFFGSEGNFIEEPMIKFFTGSVTPRVWFISESGNELIQIQNDRLHFNWRKRREGDVYPHADHLIHQLEVIATSLMAWVEKSGIGTVEYNQCEISYIDSLHFGTDLFKGFSDLGNVFRVLDLRELAPVQGIEFTMVKELGVGDVKAPNARLHFKITPGLDKVLQERLIRTESTIRGRPSESALDSVIDFLSKAREETLTFFLNVTTKEAQTFWGRTN